MKSGNLQKKHIILVKMGKIMPIRPDADPDRPDPDRHESGCQSESGSGSVKMMPIRADPDPQHWY